MYTIKTLFYVKVGHTCSLLEDVNPEQAWPLLAFVMGFNSVTLTPLPEIVYWATVFNSVLLLVKPPVTINTVSPTSTPQADLVSRRYISPSFTENSNLPCLIG